MQHKKIRVCHVTNFLPKYHKTWAGAEQACYRLVQLLIRGGFDIDILATKPIRKPKENFRFYSVPVLGDYFGNIGRKLVSVFHFDPISYFFSYKIFKKVKPDVVHLNNFDVLSFSVLASAKRLGKPVVFSVYDFWCFCPNRTLVDAKDQICRKFHGSSCVQCYGHKIFRPFYRSVFNLRKQIFDNFLSKIDVFVVLTDSGARLLQQYGISKEKIRVIPLPLSRMYAPEKVKKEKNSILYIGWISKHKGLDIAIKALPHVLEKFPDAKLYIIGSEKSKEDTAEILGLIKNLNVGKNVFLVGRKPFEEVKKYLARARVVVVPEQWEITLSMVLTEAMLFEKAIVASKIGGIPEFIKEGKTGFLADPKNPLDFADKIILLLKKKELASAIGKRARKEILQKCDEEKILKSLIQLYTPIAGAEEGK